MGHESFIHWISPEIALAYSLATTVILVGVLQVAGARWDRPDLRWFRSRVASGLFGAVLIVTASAAFYLGMKRLIFVPGLAGTELIVIFAAATLVATLLVRLVARLRGRAPAPTVVAPAAAAQPAATRIRSAALDHAPAIPALTAAPAVPLPDDIAWVTPRPADAAWVRDGRHTEVP